MWRPEPHVISFDEAVSLISGSAFSIGAETLPIASAGGRFVAAPVIAQIDAPRADSSTMDGYAVRNSDLPTLRLVGASYPGVPFQCSLGVGECVRVFTGATIPTGADRVVMQEIAEANGEIIHVKSELGKAHHIRLRGSDFRSGEILLPVGRRLNARALVAAAGADLATIEVGRQPRVAVLGTGDELAEPGSARFSAEAIPESVSIGVAATVDRQGGVCISRRRFPDDRAILYAAAASALNEADLVVMTGGASVGERDYAKAVFVAQGLELIFSKIAMKPGKPVWFGRAGSTLVMGLPGNPTSALVTARLLLAPLVRGLAGGDPNQALTWQNAVLGQPLPPCGDRETFVRARMVGRTVEALTSQDSSAQYALAQADLLIRRRAGAAEAIAGEAVEIIDF